MKNGLRGTQEQCRKAIFKKNAESLWTSSACLSAKEESLVIIDDTCQQHLNFEII